MLIDSLCRSIIAFGFRAKCDQLELSQFCSHGCRVCCSVQKWIISLNAFFTQILH